MIRDTALMRFWDGSGINWIIYKQFAPRSRQITTSTSHHSIFAGRMLFPMSNQQCQSTEGNSMACLELHDIKKTVQRYSGTALMLTLLRFLKF